MGITEKIYEAFRTHEAVQVVGEVRPYLGICATDFRFGCFRKKYGELVRGVEITAGGNEYFVKLVPLTDVQIQHAISTLQRIHDFREPGVWAFRYGWFRYRLKFRKFISSPYTDKEEVKASFTHYSYLHIAWLPLRMYRYQLGDLIEALERLRELPDVLPQSIPE